MEVEALLDSGAGIAMLDRTLAPALGLKPTRNIMIAGTSGATDVPVATGLRVVLGKLRLENLACGLVDLSHVSRAAGRKIQLILGREMFERMVVEIDFSRRNVAFHAHGHFTPDPAARRIELTPHGQVRVLDVMLEGRGPIALQFDLGLDLPLLLQEEHWKRLGLSSSRGWSNILYAGAAGVLEAPLTTLTNIEVAGVRIHDVPLVVMPPRARADEISPAGILGMPILSRFRLATDYRQNALYLAPSEAVDERPIVRDRSGLRMVFEGDHLRVLLVAKNGPAERAGWKVGDIITSIDGKPIDADYWSGDLWRWTTDHSLASARLKTSEGSERTLVLTSYY